jgi:molecular chaperone GrpE
MPPREEPFSDQTDRIEQPETGDEPAAEQQPADEPAAGWQSLVEQVEEEAGAEDPIVQLVQEYKEAIKARDEAEDKYLRAAAEFANARRRAELRADHEVRAAREHILSSFLPVVDDLARALLAVPAGDETQSWSNGFSLIQRKLDGILERQGVAAIEAEGQPFDPALHQAVIMDEVDGVASGTVVQELQKGYLLDGRVLRPSMVKVAQ